MLKAYLSIIINSFFLIYLFIYTAFEYSFKVGFIFVGLLFIIFSISGTFLYQKTGNKIYGVTAIIGFSFFIPIGLIGLFSISNKMDD